MLQQEAAISASCSVDQIEMFNNVLGHSLCWRCLLCAGVTQELSTKSFFSHGLRSMTSAVVVALFLECHLSPPLLTTIMSGWSSRGCISRWVQRASFPRNWPVFVPSAPLHSRALCDSVRPGWVIKKARAQVVIIRGLSSMGFKKKTPTCRVTPGPCFFPLSPSHTMLL